MHHTAPIVSLRLSSEAKSFLEKLPISGSLLTCFWPELLLLASSCKEMARYLGKYDGLTGLEYKTEATVFTASTLPPGHNWGSVVNEEAGAGCQGDNP